MLVILVQRLRIQCTFYGNFMIEVMKPIKNFLNLIVLKKEHFCYCITLPIYSNVRCLMQRICFVHWFDSFSLVYR